MHRIVVLGAGYAGLRAIKELRGLPNCHITLVNRHAFHYESTELHTVAAGTREPDAISFDVGQALEPGIDFKKDTVLRIDTDNKQVFLSASGTLPYDYLVVALGFESEDFGIEGVSEHALPLQDIDSAMAIRSHLEARFSAYKDTRDDNDLRVIVCGAGVTSIELLGELAYRMPRLIELHDLPAEKIKLISLEASPQILPMFEPHLVDYALGYLAQRRVQIHTSTPIHRVVSGGVVSGEQVFTANTVIWTTGVRGSRVVAASGFDAKRNRVAVEPTLTLKNHPEVFFIGDDSAVVDPSSGRPYPATAQISIAQATCAAANLKAQIAGERMTDFRFASKGTVCSLGPASGIAEFGTHGAKKLEGHRVVLLKKLIDNVSVFEEASFVKLLADLT